MSRHIRCRKCGTVFSPPYGEAPTELVCPNPGCRCRYRNRSELIDTSKPRDLSAPDSGRRWLIPVAAIGLLLALLAASLPFRGAGLPGQPVAQAAEEPAASPVAAVPPQPDFAAEIRPLLKTYCYDCHTQETQEGGLVIDSHGDLAAILAHREQWAKVFDRIRVGAMPPSDAPQPTEEERRKLVSWLDHALFYVDCHGPPRPGRVTIRRLNRSEYRNTVRDLLGVDLDVSERLPQDDVGHGFDNIGDVLSVPPLLIEKYLDAAEQVAGRAVLIRDERAFDRTFRGSDLEVSGRKRLWKDSNHQTLLSRGDFSTRIRFGKTGTYLIEWQVRGRRIDQDLVRTHVRIDDGETTRFDVVGDDKSQTFRLKTRVTEGRHRVRLEFSNGAGDSKAPDDNVRTLTVESLHVRGPLENLPDEAGGPKIAIVLPEGERSVVSAARQTIAPLLRRAFRRPVSETEVDQFVRFVTLAVDRKDPFERGLQVAVQAILVSPQFLFRVENGASPQPSGRDGSRLLTDHELASRLSYFLWSSMPDDELFRLAETGTLQRDDILEMQIRRMIEDPKSSALIDNFASQWLALRKLFTEEVSPDTEQFPEFTAKLREDMATETRLFFGAVLREDRPLTDLIDARYSFLNERLAKLYGIGGVTGEEFRKVDLPGSRRGLLTQASILTLTSYPNRTSPVKRGEWILANLLGDKPPDPPPVVPGLEETQKSNPNMPLRKQLELHRADPGCASCHKVMDELGFDLENYDAIGRWRDKEGTGKHSFDVDASGTLPTGETFRGANELTAILKEREAEFARCFVEKLLTFGLGRGLEFYDRCAVDQIVDEVRRNDMRISAAVLGVARSVPFRMRGEAAEAK